MRGGICCHPRSEGQCRGTFRRENISLLRLRRSREPDRCRKSTLRCSGRTRGLCHNPKCRCTLPSKELVGSPRGNICHRGCTCRCRRILQRRCRLFSRRCERRIGRFRNCRPFCRGRHSSPSRRRCRHSPRKKRKQRAFWWKCTRCREAKERRMREGCEEAFGQRNRDWGRCRKTVGRREWLLEVVCLTKMAEISHFHKRVQIAWQNARFPTRSRL